MRAGGNWGRLRARIWAAVFAIGGVVAVFTAIHPYPADLFCRSGCLTIEGAATPVGAVSDAQCDTCGVVERIGAGRDSSESDGTRPRRVDPLDGNGWNQGRTTLAVLGAVGGISSGSHGQAGVDDESDAGDCRVFVLMDDGSKRNLPCGTAPSVAVGNRVRVVGGALLALPN